MKPSIALIGAGAAGSALLLALHRAGYPVAAVSSRNRTSALRCAALLGAETAVTGPLSASRAADILVIATPDSQIGPVCEALAAQRGFRAGQLVLHLSGALNASELAAAAGQGADLCAFHPIQTLVEPLQGADLLKEAWYCLEGPPTGTTRARTLAETLSGKVFTLDAEHKALYHAALCVSSNYLIVLEDIATDLLVQAGLEKQAALQALLPLIRGAAANLAQSGLPDALTGPISRGDDATVANHLNALQRSRSRHTGLYRQLGLAALALAEEKGGVAPGGAEKIRRLLRNR